MTEATKDKLISKLDGGVSMWVGRHGIHWSLSDGFELEKPIEGVWRFGLLTGIRS